MNDKANPTLLGRGVYTIPQAARLARVPAASIRRWMFGYRYDYRGQTVERPPVVIANRDREVPSILTFLDLIEVQFVQAFRHEGVSWPTIRTAAEKAREIVGSDHPFASSRFVTDGQTIFAEIASTLNSRELLDLRNDQMAFRRILLPSLRTKLDVGAQGVEKLWPLGKRRPVVIDPLRQFGQPISVDEGVPTEVLAKACKALRSVVKAARWYEVTPAAVRAAVEFEQQLAA